MRKEPLSGYVLHSRPYQEKRAIYRFFCQKNGMVDGVARQGLLPFALMNAFASGQSTLKTLSQCQYATADLMPFVGDCYYGGLYMNELLYRLVPVYDPAPALFAAYVKALGLLALSDKEQNGLKQVLRGFEQTLLGELGVGLDFATDETGAGIDSQKTYRFVPTQGFVLAEGGDYLGVALLSLAYDKEALRNPSLLNLVGRINRSLIDHLLGYKPLHSRKLWQDKLTFGAKNDKTGRKH